MKTIDYILAIDTSPSMEKVLDVTIKGANEVIASLKNAARETGIKINLTVVTFDRRARVSDDFNGIDINKASKISNLILGSGTAIYEGLAVSIEAASSRVKASKKHRVVINLLTDGQNNCYGKNTPEMVKQKIGESGKFYTFAVVASEKDAIELAESMNIPNIAKYTADINGTRSAFYQISRSTRRYVERFAQNGAADLSLDYFEEIDLSKTIMKVNDYSLVVNLPESEHDSIDGLPPYAPAEAYSVDEYPACDPSWMNGSSKASSYFVGVKENSALWFDFNENNNSEYDTAVVISVQGINPLTGQKTSTLKLEKYDDKCPVHETEFKQDRFCSECGFKWFGQNFISSTSSDRGKFWLDGFKTPEGTVRQYVFTKETMRGVAQGIIGEDKVYAIGVAFYRSKNKKPKPVYVQRSFGHLRDSSKSGVRGVSIGSAPDPINSPGFFAPLHTPQNWKLPDKSSSDGILCSTDTKSRKNSVSNLVDDTDPTLYQLGPDAYEIEATMGYVGFVKFDKPEKFEVAAGEEIKQEIKVDKNSLDYWEPEPVGMIYINYADERLVKNIVASGKRKEVKEGFLANVPVGNK